ncbi:hypothetical protein GUJ93_ZPchr0001g32855 [Zizania palustris]|uniref:Transcription initiation factor IIA subunit 2 n=2 Tax=Zizania palustris TaxID=103762 RepID=A0A8J5RHZ9_ZIZPA|nr:hypothetical protein GUJ93_ZPchr0001g32855 [Zizania palustris]
MGLPLVQKRSKPNPFKTYPLFYMSSIAVEARTTVVVAFSDLGCREPSPQPQSQIRNPWPRSTREKRERSLTTTLRTCHRSPTKLHHTHSSTPGPSGLTTHKHQEAVERILDYKDNIGFIVHPPRTRTGGIPTILSAVSDQIRSDQEGMATFELYRRSTIGMCLTETLDDMVSSGALSPELAIQVLVQFDKSMTSALEHEVKSKVSVKGHLHTYRFCDNVWTFILTDATFKNEETTETISKVKIVACDSKLLDTQQG